MLDQLVENTGAFHDSEQFDVYFTEFPLGMSSAQWVRINGWFGRLRLVHEAAVEIFRRHDNVNHIDQAFGTLVGYIGSNVCFKDIPCSVIGNKMREINAWTVESDEVWDARRDEKQRVVLTGTDFRMGSGKIWISGVGDISVRFDSGLPDRMPSSIELMQDALDSGDGFIRLHYKGAIFHGQG